MDKENNPLKHAPHTAPWCRARVGPPVHARDRGVPGGVELASKFWPTNRRIDNVYGDRNLVTTHAAVEVAAEETA